MLSIAIYYSQCMLSFTSITSLNTWCKSVLSIPIAFCFLTPVDVDHMWCLNYRSGLDTSAKYTALTEGSNSQHGVWRQTYQFIVCRQSGDPGTHVSHRRLEGRKI